MKEFFEKERLILPLRLEDAINIENPLFHNRAEEKTRNGYIKSKVIFGKIPGKLSQKMTVTLMVGGFHKDAVLDPAKCRSKELLMEGRMYAVSLEYENKKLYISDYYPLMGKGKGVSAFLRGSTEKEKEGISIDGPGVRVEITGRPYNLKFTDEGLKLVINAGEETYRECLAPNEFTDRLGYVEEGKKYLFKGVLATDGIYIQSAAEADDYETVTGKAVFEELPDPDDGEFSFIIKTETEELKATLDRYFINVESDVILEEGREYEFTYPAVSAYDVHSFERISVLPPPERMGEFLEDTDKKIFCHECIKKELPDGGECHAGIILELRGKPRGIRCRDGETVFTLETDNVKYRCVADSRMAGIKNLCPVSEEREYIFDALLVGETAYIRSIYEVSDDLKEYETEISPELLAEISKLPPPKREEATGIILRGKTYGITENNRALAFCTQKEMIEKYKLLKEYYPGEVQAVVDKLLKRKGEKNAHAEKILDCMINTPWGITPKVNTDYGYLKKKLDEKFYGQDKLKETVIKIISGYKHKKNKKGASILLVGPPGVGKTSMIRYAAMAAGIPFGKISLNGVDTPYFINGTPRLYENATMGQIMETVRVCGDNGIILLDEVDKTVCGKEGNPLTGLYNLLDPGELFFDNIIEGGIDLSNIIFVLTANSTEAVPAPLLDRVSEIYLSGYTEEEKYVIARDYVIREETEKYNPEVGEIIWEDNAIRSIANKYSLTDGVRDIEKNVATVIRNAVHIMERNGEKKITVSEEKLEELLDIAPPGRREPVYEIAALRNKFRFYRYSYPERTGKAIEELFAKYEATGDRDEKEIIRKKLSYAVNFVPDKEEKFADPETVKNALDETHFGMAEVKNAILSYVAARNANPKAFSKCLWLDGPCGTGKTTICESVARATGRKFVKISLNGVTSPGYIKGFESTWKDAVAGRIAEALAQAGTDKTVILLDEIDKMTAGGSGDPYSALLDLLDSSSEFTDLFVSVPFSVSGVLFIATSNNASAVPEAVRDRMELISLAGYTGNEKITVVGDYLLKKKLSAYGLSSDVISRGVMEKTVADYCKAYGVRDAETAFDKVIREYLKRKQLGTAPSEIDYEFVRSILGAKPLKRGNVSDSPRPGMARALAVSGNCGTTFAIQITENPYGDEDEVTGLAKQSVTESVKLAKLLVGKILKRKLPPIHVHFGEGGVEKEGPSAGITIFSAMYSCFTGIETGSKTGMTGEIDAFGDVWPVGGVELKIAAAENEGCERVLVPFENYRQLAEEKKLEKYACEIIPVKNVEEVCRFMEGYEKGEKI